MCDIIVQLFNMPIKKRSLFTMYIEEQKREAKEEVEQMRGQEWSGGGGGGEESE